MAKLLDDFKEIRLHKKWLKSDLFYKDLSTAHQKHVAISVTVK